LSGVGEVLQPEAFGSWVQGSTVVYDGDGQFPLASLATGVEPSGQVCGGDVVMALFSGAGGVAAVWGVVGHEGSVGFAEESIGGCDCVEGVIAQCNECKGR
jgi:hypothetical protein